MVTTLIANGRVVLTLAFPACRTTFAIGSSMLTSRAVETQPVFCKMFSPIVSSNYFITIDRSVVFTITVNAPPNC